MIKKSFIFYILCISVYNLYPIPNKQNNHKFHSDEKRLSDDACVGCLVVFAAGFAVFNQILLERNQWLDKKNQ